MQNCRPRTAPSTVEEHRQLRYLYTMSDGKTVLIVDDCEAIREILKLSLEFEGFSVLEASNGEDAMQLLKESSSTALILLDLMMPVMNGWDFLRSVEADKSLDALPILILTAFSIKERPARVKEVLMKPLDPDRVIQSVKRFCT